MRGPPDALDGTVEAPSRLVGHQGGHGDGSDGQPRHRRPRLVDLVVDDRERLVGAQDGDDLLVGQHRHGDHQVALGLDVLDLVARRGFDGSIALGRAAPGQLLAARQVETQPGRR